MKTSALGLGLAAVVTSAASAEITGLAVNAYSQTVADFGGATSNLYTVDVYAVSNDATDTVLNAFNMTLNNGASSYYQSATGAGWLPNNLGSIFDTQALQEGDSFVTIGGFDAAALQTVGAGSSTGLDPNFGGSSAAAPGSLAGWFNSSPPNLNGRVQAQNGLGGGIGTLLGRFSTEGDAFSLEGTEISLTWNQGLGTGPQSGTFLIPVIPAPGAMALLGIAGLVGRRRRG